MTALAPSPCRPVAAVVTGGPEAAVVVTPAAVPPPTLRCGAGTVPVAGPGNRPPRSTARPARGDRPGAEVPARHARAGASRPRHERRSVPTSDDAAGPPAGASRRPAGAVPPRRPAWTLLTTHGHVLLAAARSPDARVGEIAEQVGISVRATLSVLKDLEEAGYLTRHRVGRRSHYTVDRRRHFRHPATAAHEVGELLDVLAGDPPGTG
ncbi:winged helix-turn-helix domain-containing protein [Kocuria flava]|uniref:winged helix-turn-helix domain-containing protein n=1 Tax=Kocuria flava TaxID=446860 RepID=UPI0015DFE3EF|nr:winged helix-turn-helix domain-containing protein [Kocuria flava]